MMKKILDYKGKKVLINASMQENKIKLEAIGINIDLSSVFIISAEHRTEKDRLLKAAVQFEEIIKKEIASALVFHYVPYLEELGYE